MTTLSLLLLLTDAYPLWRGWRANRDTSLSHAVGWAALAWAGWLAIPLAALWLTPGGLAAVRLLALSLTGCAGVAVLGARRPGVAAWDFVLLGLAAVMLLPLAEKLLTGVDLFDPVRIAFLASTLAAGVLNYLPTRYGLAALVVGLGCGWELWVLLTPAEELAGWQANGPGWSWVAAAPWLALLVATWRPKVDSPFNRLWLDFRDRFGFVWGQRLREQFNRAAAHAGWPVRLSWGGLNSTVGAAPGESVCAAALAALRALLKRFLPPDARPRDQ